jgi:hypothetical protein
VVDVNFACQVSVCFKYETEVVCSLQLSYEEEKDLNNSPPPL